jgi:DNA adenine methylase Dam
MDDHKEFIFITKVEKNKKKEITYRSPLFYVGDKYKLMPQIKRYMPSYINNYYEPFVGGGSSFLNIKANHYKVNDIDQSIINIHKMLYKESANKDLFFKKIFKLISDYNLSCSYNGHLVPEELKAKYKKTYYSRYNKEQYVKLRFDYNKDKKDIMRLYLLLIYGFNHMTRFNSKGDFNLPVGNVDFNSNVYNSLNYYLDYIRNIDIEYTCLDYKEFIHSINFSKNDYILLDPPYLISQSEYNKLWSENDDKDLCNLLDYLDSQNIKFGITNLLTHKGNKNRYFEKWASKYHVYEIKSNYISFNDNKIKSDSREVFVTNYDKGNE